MKGSTALSTICRSLHWLVAIGFISVSLIGLYMVQAEHWAWYDLHKSLGILLFILILGRVGWRLKHGWPAPLNTEEMRSQRLAKIMHGFLLLGTVLMPVSGLFYSGLSGHGFGVFGWGLLAENLDPLQPGQVTAHSVFWSDFSQQFHWLAGYLLLLAIGLHVAAALKHHYGDKDATLRRMLTGKTQL